MHLCRNRRDGYQQTRSGRRHAECIYAAIEEMGINKHVLDWTKAHGVQLCCNGRDGHQQTHSGRRHTECRYAVIEEMGINQHILDEGTWTATMLQLKRWVSINTFWTKTH